MPDPEASKNPLVLLVEDDPFMSGLLAEAFQHELWRVALVLRGEDAVERFSHERPDLVVVDILLPGMNGLAVLREIRRLPGGDVTPAIVLSNLEDGGYVREAEALGAAAYLVKANVQTADVVAKAKEILKR